MTRLRRILIAVVLLGAPAPAHAQILDIMDWIERMSGPELPGPWVNIPLLCWYVDDARRYDELKASDQPLIKTTPGSQVPNKPRFPIFENPTDRRTGLTRCAPLVLRGSVNRATGEVQATGLTTRRLIVGVRLGFFGANHDWPRNGDTNLTYDPSVPESDKKIAVFAIGPSVNWSVHRNVDLFWALEWNHFYGPLFDSFDKASVDVLGLAYRPFDDRAHPLWASFLQLTLKTKLYLGTIRAEDFGAIPGSFESRFESVLSVGATFDISRLIWH